MYMNDANRYSASGYRQATILKVHIFKTEVASTNVTIAEESSCYCNRERERGERERDREREGGREGGRGGREGEGGRVH